MDHHRGRTLHSAAADRLHRPLSVPPARQRDRHRGDAVRALRSRAQRQGPRDRNLELSAADIVEAHWVAERRGFERLRCEQPNYSILNRGIERDVLPVTQRYGVGTIVWSPLARGLLTGRVRKGQPSELTRSGAYYAHLRDERRIDVVEQLIPVADQAGMTLAHLADGTCHCAPRVTAALLGPRMLE